MPMGSMCRRTRTAAGRNSSAPAHTLSVHVSATRGPAGALTVDRTVTGRLAVEDATPGVALSRALAAAALPHAGFGVDAGALLAYTLLSSLSS